MASGHESRPAPVSREAAAHAQRWSSRFRNAVRALPPYPTASALAACLLCGSDYALTRGPRDAVSAALLLWCALLLGALHGAGWQLAFAALAPVARRFQILCWLALAQVPAALLARSLGAAARLDGPYHRLAIAALASCGLGAIGLGVLLSAMQSSEASASGTVFGWRASTRAVMAVGALAAAIGLFIGDHRILVGLYPSAHHALRYAAVLLGSFALCLVPELLPLPRMGLRSAGALGLISAAVIVVPAARFGGSLLALTTHPWSSDALRLTHRLFDLDRDGYSGVLGGGDCNDLDWRVHPNAREIPDNGVDDNCALGDRTSKPQIRDQIPTPTSDSPLDVVFITIDTLRPDHLGIYNGAYGPKGRATSPNLDAWAASGAYVFRNAFSPGGWTVIALSSTMRGLYPRRLDWTPAYETSRFRVIPERLAGQMRRGEHLLQFFAFPSQDSHVTLAELLQRRRMRTIAVVDDGYSDMFQPGTGLSGGFDVYEHMPNAAAFGDQLTIDRALGVLAEVPHNQRFFMWVHIFGPHSPNERVPNVRYMGPTLEDGYDHEILYADSQVGRLLQALAARRPEPLVIVAGDHGEDFEDGNRFHGYMLDEALMRIPLLIRVPSSRGRTIQSPVSLIDVFATVLGATKTPGPRILDSVDLTPLLAGAHPAPRVVITDCWRYLADRRRVLDGTGVTDGARFVFQDFLTGTSYWTNTRSSKQHWLSPADIETDPLVRALLAYSEEANPLPQ